MLVEKTDKNRLLVPKFFEYLGINNRVVIGKKYAYIKSKTHILCVCVCVCTFFLLQSVWVPNFISKVKKLSRSFCRSLHVFSTFSLSEQVGLYVLKVPHQNEFEPLFFWRCSCLTYELLEKTIKRFSWIDTVSER